MSACPAQTACSAGVCLCPATAPRIRSAETQTRASSRTWWAGALPVSGGHRAPGQHPPLRPPDEDGDGGEVRRARRGVFALDSDSMGNLLWCSDVVSGDSTRTGQLVHGTQVLDTGACTHVAPARQLRLLQGRRPLPQDPGPGRHPRRPSPANRWKTFEIAGDHLYFVDELEQEAVLKRLPLADEEKVETILAARTASSSGCCRTPPRLPDRRGADPEGPAGGKRPGGDVLARGGARGLGDGPDRHCTCTGRRSTTSGRLGCSEAQILRSPKAGGPVTTLSRNPGYCAGQLVRIGNVLYAAIWTGPLARAPTRILRIRL